MINLIVFTRGIINKLMVILVKKLKISWNVKGSACYRLSNISGLTKFIISGRIVEILIYNTLLMLKDN